MIPIASRSRRRQGPLFGLTPRKYQSGEKDVTSGITRAGDEMVRTALYEAANFLLARITRFSKLKRWAICGGLTVDHGRKRELGDATINRGDLTSPGPFTHKIVRSVTAI